ncbi:MAG: aminopeptidase, partial [Gaiellaceae bacterium]
MTDPTLVERFAELVVGYGANVQPGQVVELATEVGKEEISRAIAVAAYRRGTRFVDLTTFDMHVKRARLAHAADETLDYVPPWYGERVLALGREHAAMIALNGPAAPGLLDGIDPVRIGRDRLPSLKEYVTVVNERTVNWCIAPGPTAAWAQLVYPELEPEAALELLWEAIAHICRLDEDDPIAAWTERVTQLDAAAARLSERRFDALHFEGPGTDLMVGLLPSSRWLSGRSETVDGIWHLPNLPTEEAFSAPDPARVDGVARATLPLELSGAIGRGLEVRFEGGRAVSVEAETGAETVLALIAKDGGAARLGEVALVDREGRVGPLETVFY